MLSILGIVVIVIASIHTYRSARDCGRRAGLWLFAVLAVGIGLQFVIPFFIGLVIAIVYLAKGATQAELMEAMAIPSMIIGVVALGTSIAAMLYISNRAAIVPDEPLTAGPPPPPAFEE